MAWSINIFPPNLPVPSSRVAPGGLDGHDVAFMERLRNLAEEALTWEHLSDQQRLVWAAMLELDVVPVQEMRVARRGCSHCCCKIIDIGPFSRATGHGCAAFECYCKSLFRL